MKASTEAALERCGRDRVMHRDNPPSVAIRLDPIGIGEAEGKRFSVHDGATLDEAGQAAALAYAARLRSHAHRLTEMAASIERALRGDS